MATKKTTKATSPAKRDPNTFEVVDDGSTLAGSELAYTQKVIAAARQLQRRGWDIYYRSSS